jgi:hypothetical protein
MSQFCLLVNTKAAREVAGRGGCYPTPTRFNAGRPVSVAALKALEAVEGSIEAAEA